MQITRYGPAKYPLQDTTNIETTVFIEGHIYNLFTHSKVALFPRQDDERLENRGIGVMQS